MKRFVRIICLLLVFSTVLVIPVSAAENISPWGSSYFGSTLSYLHKTSGTTFQVWIEVTTGTTMDKLGASEIIVQRSSDNSNWTDVMTYTKEAYTNMVKSNAFSHKTYVTYTGTSGYYYRAEVTFYAKKGNGTAEYDYTTASVYVS